MTEDLKEQIKKAQAEMAKWSEEKRKSVRLEGTDLWLSNVAPTQGADARPVANQSSDLTRWRDEDLVLVERRLVGAAAACARKAGALVIAEKLRAAWAVDGIATHDAAPSDAQDAARYRWLSKLVVITDGSTPGLMVITAVDDGIEYGNQFLDEFTEPALAAIESQRRGDGS
jgi:hypothetical protein